MWMNFMLRTYAWQSLLEKKGVLNALLNAVGLPSQHLINTPWAIILGMIYDFLPFMVLPIYNALKKIDPNLIHASHDLGAGFWQTLSRVIFPLSLPGVVSGITMVFVPSISTFYISQKLGGGQYLLIGDAIERAFGNPEKYSVGAAMSFVLMLIVLISTAVMNRFDRENAKGGVMV